MAARTTASSRLPMSNSSSKASIATPSGRPSANPEALGFLEVEHGQAGNREYRWPSTYRLTYLPVGRARPTNEWQRIRTMEEAEAIARVARKTSAGGKQKTSAGKRTGFGVGNHHRKPNFSVPVSVTTVPVPETGTTSRLSGPISTASASAATASESHHEREPVLMRGGTPASPATTTLTTARADSADQKEGNGQ